MWPDLAIYWTLNKFLKPLATIKLSKSPTFFGNFCKGVKTDHSSREIIFGQLLETFGDFFWSDNLSFLQLVCQPSLFITTFCSDMWPQVFRCPKGALSWSCEKFKQNWRKDKDHLNWQSKSSTTIGRFQNGSFVNTFSVEAGANVINKFFSRPFFFIYPFNTVDSKQMFNSKILLLTGFEPRTSGIGSDHSTKWATSTAQSETSSRMA